MWEWPNDLSLYYHPSILSRLSYAASLPISSACQLPLIYKSLNHPSFISQLEVPFSKEKEHQAKHSNLIHFTPTTLLLTQFHFSSLFLSQTIICRLFRRLLPTLSIWSTCITNRNKTLKLEWPKLNTQRGRKRGTKPRQS